MESVWESSVQAIISHCEKTLTVIQVDLESAKKQLSRIGRLKIGSRSSTDVCGVAAETNRRSDSVHG
jgi:hypothetical protein